MRRTVIPALGLYLIAPQEVIAEMEGDAFVR